MNVLLIFEQDGIDGFGGTATYLRRTVDGLLQLGHNVFLSYPQFAGEKDHCLQGVKLLPIEIQRDTYRKNIKSFANILNNSIHKIINDNKVEIVHLIFGWYAFHYIDFTKILDMGKKVFVTVHNVPPQECRNSYPGDSCIRRLRGALYELFQVLQSFYFIQKVDKRVRIIVPCDNVKKRLKKYYSQNVIKVIHHGYDNSFLPDIIEDTKNERSFCEILTVAGIAPGKNLNFLINVASKLHNKDRYHFTIVGTIRNQRYYSLLQKRIMEMGLEKNFRFCIGCSNEELLCLYKESTLYVQPSRDEGFCLAALDAAAIGLKIIGSDIGEIGSIAKLSGGREVRYNDVDDYCRAIEELSEDHLCLSAEKAKDVRMKYNWNKTTKLLVEFYY